jgi:hypothetical protein
VSAVVRVAVSSGGHVCGWHSGPPPAEGIKDYARTCLGSGHRRWVLLCRPDLLVAKAPPAWLTGLGQRLVRCVRCIATYRRCRRGHTGGTETHRCSDPLRVSRTGSRERTKDKTLERSETDSARSGLRRRPTGSAGSCGLEESHDAIDCDLANLQPRMCQASAVVTSRVLRWRGPSPCGRSKSSS